MVDIRTVSLPGIWAEDAQTTIPTPPIANTTYRNLEWGETEANQGWPFQKIVDSADFNQAMWYIFTLQQMQEQFGILPWCSTTAYKQNGICLGSDGIFYWAKSDNTGVNPVNDTGMTTWGIFLDPGDNFVTETVLMNQINLCEKLANKVQSLSASSTIDQYPSAKCVYDNINNLASTKQNNITGGASSITTNNLTANRALLSDGNGKVAVSNITNTELNYLDGVSSNIQTQLNGKQASGSYVTTNTTQTITGLKTFTQTPFMNASGNPYGFIAQNNAINVGQTPPVSQYIGYDIRGNNGTRAAFIGIFYAPTGDNRKYLLFQNLNNAYDVAYFETNVQTARTLGAADNSKNFAYTSWVNSRISSIVNTSTRGSNYVKLNNLIIQWGRVLSQPSNLTISFNIPFTNANSISMAVMQSNSQSANSGRISYRKDMGASAYPTVSNFTIEDARYSYPFTWIAIGY